jgi:hypothetical protein
MGMPKYPTSCVVINPELKKEVIEAAKVLRTDSGKKVSFSDVVNEALNDWLNNQK